MGKGSEGMHGALPDGQPPAQNSDCSLSSSSKMKKDGIDTRFELERNQSSDTISSHLSCMF